jgi:catechol 2,3-dioxygenase-like lactoylglutathione lyase family enzyme
MVVSHSFGGTREAKRNAAVDMKLEVVVVPVLDVDRAKTFYRSIGFDEDVDYACGEGYRVVQLTSPGSATSIIVGTGITDAVPGSLQGVHLVVRDIEAARAELLERNIDVGPVFHDVDGVFYRASPACAVLGPDPARREYASFARFQDPDGNGWILQEGATTAGGG